MEDIDHPTWETFLECKLEHLYKNPESLEKFKKLTTNYERIDFIENKFFYSSLIERHLVNSKLNPATNEGKNFELSETFRKKGNEYYSKRDNQNAFKFYTLALQYAEHESKSLYLAYSNRSAVFFDTQKYHECLNDLETIKNLLDKSLFSQDPKEFFNFLLKLYTRECNCLIKLNKTDTESKFLNILKAPQFDVYEAERSPRLESLLKLMKEHVPKASETQKDNVTDFKNFISDSVSIEYSTQKGRHCKSTRKIKAGEVLFTEKAYCAILLPDSISKYCDLCLKSLYNDVTESFYYLNLQPCNECSSVLYCSEKCKHLSMESNNDGDRFHKFECKILKSLLHEIGVGHLAYRILNSTSQKLIEKYSRVQKTGEYEPVEGFNYRLDTYEDNYKQVFYLLTHETETHVDDLFKYSLTSLLLGKYYVNLMKNQNGDYLRKISSLILRHLLQSICNANAISELKDDSKESKQTYNRQQLRYATAIYPRVSLLNHSCNSNVLSTFKQDSSVLVIKACRDINESEEVYNSYGPHYIKMTYPERKQALKEQYHFDCECPECLKQSQIFYKNVKTGLRCLKCKTGEVWSNGHKSRLIQIKCLRCNEEKDFGVYVYKFNYLDEFLAEFNPELDEKMNKVMIARVGQMVKDYGQYLMVTEELDLESDAQVDSNMKTLYLDFSKLIDLLARLYCNDQNMKLCCTILEKNIKLLDFIYNTRQSGVNVEIGHELFKLAELQCTISHFKKAYKNINRAITIGECVYSKQSQVLNEYYELKNNIEKLLEMS